MRVICIGECMVELRATGADASPEPMPETPIIRLSTSNARCRTPKCNFLTGIADDPMSRAMREVWSAEGIDSALGFTVKGGSPGL